VQLIAHSTVVVFSPVPIIGARVRRTLPTEAASAAAAAAALRHAQVPGDARRSRSSSRVSYRPALGCGLSGSYTTPAGREAVGRSVGRSAAEEGGSVSTGKQRAMPPAPAARRPPPEQRRRRQPAFDYLARRTAA